MRYLRDHRMKGTKAMLEQLRALTWHDQVGSSMAQDSYRFKRVA